jgi:hypothetical protein
MALGLPYIINTSKPIIIGLSAIQIERLYIIDIACPKDKAANLVYID